MTSLALVAPSTRMPRQIITADLIISDTSSVSRAQLRNRRFCEATPIAVRPFAPCGGWPRSPLRWVVPFARPVRPFAPCLSRPRSPSAPRPMARAVGMGRRQLRQLVRAAACSRPARPGDASSTWPTIFTTGFGLWPASAGKACRLWPRRSRSSTATRPGSGSSANGRGPVGHLARDSPSVGTVAKCEHLS
jgi:hypothetical protein